MISCKTSCRERWKLDEYLVKYPPKLYILATLNSDYPSSSKFKESNMRKIATAKRKKNDSRKYKLSIEDIPNEINYRI